MSEIAWKAGARPPSRLRGVFVEWPEVGTTVEGVVTFLNFAKGRTDPNGNMRGLLQIYDPSFLDQGPDDHGHYRRIDSGQRALVSAVESCVRAGLGIGGHIKLTFTEEVENTQQGLNPWKRFSAVWADPTLSPERIAAIVADGQRGESANGRPPPPPRYRLIPSPARSGYSWTASARTTSPVAGFPNRRLR